MSIQVYDFKNAPVWVQYLNIMNLFLLGFAIDKFAGYGFSSTFVVCFILYGCLYGLTIGQFFIPKKTCNFLLVFFSILKSPGQINPSASYK